MAGCFFVHIIQPVGSKTPSKVPTEKNARNLCQNWAWDNWLGPRCHRVLIPDCFKFWYQQSYVFPLQEYHHWESTNRYITTWYGDNLQWNLSWFHLRYWNNWKEKLIFWIMFQRTTKSWLTEDFLSRIYAPSHKSSHTEGLWFWQIPAGGNP